LKRDVSLLREVSDHGGGEDSCISALLAARLEQIVRERKTYDGAKKRALARLRAKLWLASSCKALLE
jgi:hypothetical protein